MQMKEQTSKKVRQILHVQKFTISSSKHNTKEAEYSKYI